MIDQQQGEDGEIYIVVGNERTFPSLNDIVAFHGKVHTEDCGNDCRFLKDAESMQVDLSKPNESFKIGDPCNPVTDDQDGLCHAVPMKGTRDDLDELS